MARSDRNSSVASGFTLLELVVAMFLAIVVLGATFGLLHKGQRSFARETRVAEVNNSLNAALDMITRDLANAGYKTPPSATVWASESDMDGSDQLTAVYAVGETATTVRPLRCTDAQEGNPCQDIAYLSSLLVDADDLYSAQRDLERAFNRGDILLAVERVDCNGDEEVGILPLDLTHQPVLDETGNYIDMAYRIADRSDLALPEGYNNQVLPDCAEIGSFRVIQYRVALDDKSIPTLERRDYSQSEPWIPVASDVGLLDVELLGPAEPMAASEPQFMSPNDGFTSDNVMAGGDSGGRSAGSVKVTLRGGRYEGSTGYEPPVTTTSNTDSPNTSAPGNSSASARGQRGGTRSNSRPSSTSSSGSQSGSNLGGTASTSGEEPAAETSGGQTTVTTTVTLRNTETYENTTVPLSGSRKLAELPNIPDISCGESNGNILRVSQDGDFQDALNRALPGDTILLEAGATFMGSFELPRKSGDACITIRSSAQNSQLPSPDTRVTPAYRRYLPKIISPGSNQAAIETAQGAHHYKFVAVEIRPVPGAYISDLVKLGGNAGDISLLPHHLEFDRVYIHGDPKVGGKRGIALNSGSTTIKNSYISDFKSTQQDTQAICGWSGPGPFRIVNNYLEAAGENVMFGGASPGIDGLVPSDIEVRGNHFKKPLSWKADDPSYAGTLWSVKNLFELKNGRRVLVVGNILENSWHQSQTGFAVVLKTSSGGGAPWTVTEDVTLENNVIRGANNGINLCAKCTYDGTPGKRFTIRNNLFDDIGSSQWGPNGGRLLQILSGVDDVIVEHNTFANQVPRGHAVIADGGTSERFVYQDNIVPHNLYGVFGSGKGEGKSALDAYFPGALFRRNVIVHSPKPSLYPKDNFFPESFQDVGFVNYATGNYRLAASSPYKNAGSDGNDIGADMDAIHAATTGVE